MDRFTTAVTVFNNQAKQYQDKFMNVDLYRYSLDLFCNSIAKENARILDIACGPGNITKYLLEKRPGFQILGIDLSPNMLVLAKTNNPTAQFQLMDCRDIATIGKKYDAIVCGFCLPYLSKEEALKLIRDSSVLLNSGGLLYLSTMEDDYSKSGLRTASSGDRLYVHYHQADNLLHALEENGFKIIDIRRQEFPTDDDTKITDLLIIVENKKDC